MMVAHAGVMIPWAASSSMIQHRIGQAMGNRAPDVSADWMDARLGLRVVL